MAKNFQSDKTKPKCLFLRHSNLFWQFSENLVQVNEAVYVYTPKPATTSLQKTINTSTRQYFLLYMPPPKGRYVAGCKVIEEINEPFVLLSSSFSC